jgi:hypothetical protein
VIEEESSWNFPIHSCHGNAMSDLMLGRAKQPDDEDDGDGALSSDAPAAQPDPFWSVLQLKDQLQVASHALDESGSCGSNCGSVSGEDSSIVSIVSQGDASVLPASAPGPLTSPGKCAECCKPCVKNWFTYAARLPACACAQPRAESP